MGHLHLVVPTKDFRLIRSLNWLDHSLGRILKLTGNRPKKDLDLSLTISTFCPIVLQNWRKYVVLTFPRREAWLLTYTLYLHASFPAMSPARAWGPLIGQIQTTTASDWLTLTESSPERYQHIRSKHVWVSVIGTKKPYKPMLTRFKILKSSIFVPNLFLFIW